MRTNWEGIRSKSYTLPGIDGGELTISETADRLAIEVTIRRKNDMLLGDWRTVRITAAQFEALCGMSSPYDGLEVRPVQSEPPAVVIEVAEDADEENELDAAQGVQ